ncbi:MULTISPECIES: methionine/alanine import family NSS transporter small subunit [Oceanobacillus]|nr:MULTISPECIES: methionine/alanine import family NSS transporter small subunit [Oceanobacillus]MBT2601185.1 methionine/alanine import family NSS transporter small subunit [Oceanobacillus sp. ISL-74]MBT2652410.1 methionine/alanine import family NSS transporter small subunit [Oceanobacillus sp. ISL-73]MCT1579074.1 methionine/alanine import family NSS transporter small subunit [Oceanobacillus kimchii]MCT2137398.1 methionine/alanine import family NSS transporter small subunit [Oceanobacillus kimch
MSASAITVMIIGMVILWGGLAASIWNTIRKGKTENN